jgi:hypothetical protein
MAAEPLGLCPSGRPDDPNLRDKHIFGIVAGTPEAPAVEYLKDPIPLSTAQAAEWSATLPIGSDEIFRVAGKCKGEGCRQWDEKGQTCSLIDRWVVSLKEVTHALPKCSIRNNGCRGWMQSGAAACRRCPGFASKTLTGLGDDPLRRVELDKIYL